MARPRIRNSSNLHLYSADTGEGYRLIKIVSSSYGEERVAKGEWRRLYDPMLHRLVGYQPVERRFDVTESSDPSHATLLQPEMKANAGLFGRSRTQGMRAQDREGRMHPKSHRLLPEEDFVERVQVLVREIYPQSANFADINLKRPGLAPGGDRAVRMYPKLQVRTS
jgi:hypothetical protein